jgi:hypothetical protein
MTRQRPLCFNPSPSFAENNFALRLDEPIPVGFDDSLSLRQDGQLFHPFSAAVLFAGVGIVRVNRYQTAMACQDE